MMAFFLVMWLASQDSHIRDAVAGYFQEPGLLPYQQSNSVIASGNGGIDSAGMPVLNRKFNGQLEAEQKALVKAAGHIHQHLSELDGFASLKNQVEFSVTLEGLRIELSDRSGSSFFASGSSQMAPEADKILRIIAAEVGQLENDVVVEGHTDGTPYATANGYTNWELSSDRALATRRVLLEGGIDDRQIGKVVGVADRELELLGRLQCVAERLDELALDLLALILRAAVVKRVGLDDVLVVTDAWPALALQAAHTVEAIKELALQKLSVCLGIQLAGVDRRLRQRAAARTLGGQVGRLPTEAPKL